LETYWESYEKTFEIACLLHDCGHSPFSHTFENFYTKGTDINRRLIKYYRDNGDNDFENDLKEASPKPHELISALILIEKFGELVNNCQGNPLLAARMIIGCIHQKAKSTISFFENRLIRLLNGTVFDMDSLDYIQRDTWASGVSNISIDYTRLLSSLMIKNDRFDIPIIVFKKQALSVLNNVCLGRNFLYRWIYSHHKVIYEQYLLKTSIDKVNSRFDNKLCTDLFSIENFYKPISFNNWSFYLTTDDDVVHILKYYFDIEEIKELFYRKYHYKALWKTKFEFDHFFGKPELPRMISMAGRIRNDELKSDLGYDTLCLDADPKVKGIDKDEIYIDIDGIEVDASKASIIHLEMENYFIVYVKDEVLRDKDRIIDQISRYHA
jgi:HD superfamily phosphohydrolase